MEQVSINLGQPIEEKQGEDGLGKAREYMEKGQYGIYNMLPKFRAAAAFIEQRKGRRALITSFDKVKDGLKGKAGTIIR